MCNHGVDLVLGISSTSFMELILCILRQLFQIHQKEITHV